MIISDRLADHTDRVSRTGRGEVSVRDRRGATGRPPAPWERTRREGAEEAEWVGGWVFSGDEFGHRGARFREWPARVPASQLISIFH